MKLCDCGCGQEAPIAVRTDRRIGHIAGEPIRFCRGHNMLKNGLPLSWKCITRADGKTLIDDATWARARHLWDTRPDLTTVEIAQTCGLNMRTFEKHRARHDWGHRPRGGNRVRRIDGIRFPLEPNRPLVERQVKLRRCLDGCYGLTLGDGPCQHCGAAWNRTRKAVAA